MLLGSWKPNNDHMSFLIFTNMLIKSKAIINPSLRTWSQIFKNVFLD